MAFLVILHLSQEPESNLAEILQRHTEMPVAQVVQPVVVEPEEGSLDLGIGRDQWLPDKKLAGKPCDGKNVRKFDDCMLGGLHNANIIQPKAQTIRALKCINLDTNRDNRMLKLILRDHKSR
jgi:hypothetical protein